MKPTSNVESYTVIDNCYNTTSATFIAVCLCVYFMVHHFINSPDQSYYFLHFLPIPAAPTFLNNLKLLHSVNTTLWKLNQAWTALLQSTLDYQTKWHMLHTNQLLLHWLPFLVNQQSIRKTTSFSQKNVIYTKIIMWLPHKAADMFSEHNESETSIGSTLIQWSTHLKHKQT